jgi:hypothetical protein
VCSTFTENADTAPYQRRLHLSPVSNIVRGRVCVLREVGCTFSMGERGETPSR